MGERTAALLAEGCGEICEISVALGDGVVTGYAAPAARVPSPSGVSVAVTVVVSPERIVTSCFSVGVSVGWVPVAVRVGVRVGNSVRVGPLVGVIPV